MTVRPRVVRLPTRGVPWDEELRALFATGRARKIDRTTCLGNPFPLPRGATPEERVFRIDLYRAWLDGEGPDEITLGRRRFSRTVQLAEIAKLGDVEVLGCHCPLLACHGNVIAERVAVLSAIV